MTSSSPSVAKAATVAVIVPPVVCHNLDPHTGIPFMPHVAAHLVGALEHAGYDTYVMDCFGTAPNTTTVIGEFLLMGLHESDVVRLLPPTVTVCYIYCRTIAEFIAVERLIPAIKSIRPGIKIVLFENVHAVTSYSLRHVVGEFLSKGADCILMGEPEERVAELNRRLDAGENLVGVGGIAFLKDGEPVTDGSPPTPKNLDALPRPGWEKFPLKGYWTAGFAHAPCRRGERFLPILTSRGCPYRCNFCIAPEVNPTWRGRSAAHVVDEMEYFYRTLNVTDFHVSDLDPTVSDKRTRAICEEIIARKIPITWKLAQGTKIETIKSEETIDLMAKAGCKFISFSPESGSERLLKVMNKPFDHQHGLRMQKQMHKAGIRTQAVFLAGIPTEAEEDRDLSAAYARKLLMEGLDELSLVIFTPLPGAVFSKEYNEFTHYSQCTPSPAWRKDYAVLMAYRRRMYLLLLLTKLRYHPLKVWRNFTCLLSLKFETKLEMSLFKQIKLYVLRYFLRGSSVRREI
ncbi:MAG: B12-binding domain-containing radical SAM protein [Rhodospirillum sp.]|nr:B12-binding domain-containing radical SAM protein [Rhodospirillum sp.]MCF8489095.1 B12-binding domain-containing radical SAM protein [Rhodospirillum sp.]MCF8498885.1 B12-binding domain-containing radical SAM protein [Rhodospirillum sp.]